MKAIFGSVCFALMLPGRLLAGGFELQKSEYRGTFSLGTRNAISFFNNDASVGIGIGGQFRLQILDRLNSEWYLDYITSKNETYTMRNDYHIGWSVLYYFGKEVQFEKLFQPYFIAGHCFDYSKVSQQSNPENSADRLSMATQAGLGTHFNITSAFDCSLSAQYMLHFEKEIETTITDEAIVIEKKNFSTPEGHLLFVLSFNYKFADLW